MKEAFIALLLFFLSLLPSPTTSFQGAPGRAAITCSTSPLCLGRRVDLLRRGLQPRRTILPRNPTTALRMASSSGDDTSKEDEKQPSKKDLTLPFALPSLSQLLYLWLIAVSGSRLAASLPLLLDPAVTATANIQGNIAVNGVLCVASLVLLAKSLQKIDYDALEDLDQNSLARQAGKWAREGLVPTTFEYSNNNEKHIYHVATLAGGCFWGTELHYQRIPGVMATCVGYTQGSIPKPTYEQVCSGSTGHTEGVQLIYDPAVVSYERLVHQLLDTIDPTLLNRVGNDRGTQYRHGVYPHTTEQAETAARVLQEAQADYDRPIVTEVRPAAGFWPAENTHQRYLEKRGQSAAKNCQEKVRCYG